MTAESNKVWSTGIAGMLLWLLSSTTAAATFLFFLLPASALAAGAGTEPASKVHHTTAVLNGHLDPEGDPGVVACSFEWGKTTSYGNTAPCAQGNSFSAATNVSADLSGLQVGTTYHFRLDIETTSSGGFQGADRSFTTRLAPLAHPLLASFGPNGTASTSFGTVNQLTVDQARHKLYAFDRSTKRIYGFDISLPPAFPPASGFSTIQLDGTYPYSLPPLAADSSTSLGSAGNLYFGTDVTKEFTTPGQVEGFKASGSPLGGFPINPTVSPGPPLVNNAGALVTGVAVAPDGDIWVRLNEPDSKFFLRYSPTGTYLEAVSSTTFGGRIAFDTNGDLYSTSGGSIWKYTASSNYTTATEFAPEVTGVGEVYGLAIDPSTHYVYASTIEGLIILSPSGEQFDQIHANFGEDGVAVDPAAHDIYIAHGSKIDAYGSGAPLPALAATTAAAGPIGGDSATLNGFVDPEGTAVSECKFEYSSSSGFGAQVPCKVNPGGGFGDVAVSATATDLTPGVSYHYRLVAANAFTSESGKSMAFKTNPLPGVGSPAVSNLAFGSADLEAAIEPKGFETSYHFEYGPTPAYGTTVPIPDASAGSGSGIVTVSAHVSGLSPDTTYHWRLVADSANGKNALPDQTFVSYGPVKAETVGSPIRTATSARLEGRVDPDGAPTTFHFEYGDQGPCSVNPCTALPSRSAGSGNSMELVSEAVSGLEPGTTYYYRVTAENAVPGSPSIGGDMTVTTRASDERLSHGNFPGPPDSDRAYEQVSLAETAGNPVDSLVGISDDGNRVLYRIHGGNPVSSFGDDFNQLFAQRTASGWQAKDIFPSREESVGSGWQFGYANADLSSLASVNENHGVGINGLYRLYPDAPAKKIYQLAAETGLLLPTVSDDMSLVTSVEASGPQDPAHVYDVTSGTPEEIDQLPDGTFPICGSFQEGANRSPHWLSADGNLSFFQTRGDVCSSEPQLYVRNLEAGETKRVSPPAVSGPTCAARLLRTTPDAAFFWSTSRLVESDSPGVCGEGPGGDIYVYDLTDESVRCLTCVSTRVEADVASGEDQIAIAEGGERVYFHSPNNLVADGGPGIYRVNVSSGKIAYVGDTSRVGMVTRLGEAISPDGSTLIFTSHSSGLNALGGQQNGGTQQYYLYNDNDRSLICVSCPQDGSEPTGAVGESLVPDRYNTGPNVTPLSVNGEVFAFATPTALLSADQNSPKNGQNPNVGTDVYEWRDGQLLLVTDGLTSWPVVEANGGVQIEAPQAGSVSRSGRDIYFLASAQYTPDALDGYRRLYDARIDGGFEVPPVPKPCPLEVCQGTPKGTPEVQSPGTGTFAGQDSAQHKRSHRKKKAHKRKRHTKHQRRENDKRGAGR